MLSTNMFLYLFEFSTFLISKFSKLTCNEKIKLNNNISTCAKIALLCVYYKRFIFGKS